MKQYRRVLTPLEKQCELKGACFVSQIFCRVDLSDAVFFAARCENTRFVEVSLKGADFRGAILINALFARCDLQDADFREAQVMGARFISCPGLKPSTARGLQVDGAIISEEGPLMGGDDGAAG
jgi:uncharacterized protein YjbI with pentapeptide repeats